MTSTVRKGLHDSNHRTNYDSLQLILLILASLFNTDGIDILNNKELVEKKQSNYLSLLHRYLKSKNEKTANAHLHQTLMLPPLAVQMYHKLKKGLNQ